MRVTEIIVKTDDGGVLEYKNPKGFNLADILGILGLSADSIVNPEPGTWQGVLNGLITTVLGILMKRFGL